MSWRFEIKESAERSVSKFDISVQHRIKERLHWLVANFDHINPQPLEFEYKGFFKLRVGDWRIVYEVKEDEKLIIVHAVDRRDKIYKRKL